MTARRSTRSTLSRTGKRHLQLMMHVMRMVQVPVQVLVQALVQVLVHICNDTQT